MTPYRRVQNQAQEDRLLTGRAVELRKAGLQWASIGRELEIPPERVKRLVGRSAELICTRCAENLRHPSVSGHCGFCDGELAEAAA